jgi:ergothioneine biosynthesis protein EgtB
MSSEVPSAGGSSTPGVAPTDRSREPARPRPPSGDGVAAEAPPIPDASLVSPRLRATDTGTPMMERYRRVRQFSVDFCDPLAPEDMVVQTKENVSPTKWHLAHTTWFWETFLLREHLDGYEPIDDTYAYLFNSYYIQAGERHCRDQRGYISRPTVAGVMDFRRHVDAAMQRLWEDASAAERRQLAPLIEIGMQHEQQHQELMVTDLKHVLGVNPLRPAYRDDLAAPAEEDPLPLAWQRFDEGLREIGYDGDGFCYDNEEPRHRTFVEAFALANRPVTNGEFIEFIEDGGYEEPSLWLSPGWATVQEKDWTEPFYWEKKGGGAGRTRYVYYTLGGERPVDPDASACHLSYYEAEAFARWAGARLPSEAEWEIAARSRPVEGNFVGEEHFHPVPATHESAGGPASENGHAEHGERSFRQLYGDVWEWTRSAYGPYPGYEPLPGAIGEYNGKFMAGQFVLRGGSCATSRDHMRPTYRNFFWPDECWQFTGLRLAKDAP